MIFANVAYAQENVTVLVQKVSFYVLNPILSIIFGAAFLVFLWGIIEYFWQQDSEEARTKATRHMIWGLLGMFIMFAAFTIVTIINNTLGGPGATRVDPGIF